MRAIILAGGQGKRLEPYTKKVPKCLLKFGNRSLLERQLALYRSHGVDDIVVLKWYLEHLINFPDVRYYIDPELHNMLFALFCAEQEITGDVIIGYGDLLFESRVLVKLMESPHDISTVVDLDWKRYYKTRFEDPYAGAESLVLGEGHRILEIGRPHPPKEDVQGQYIGLIKLSSVGSQIFRQVYRDAEEQYWDKPWQSAQLFQKAYMTDLLQAILSQGFPVHAVPIHSGWLEFDTVADYENALKWYTDGSLDRFLELGPDKGMRH